MKRIKIPIQKNTFTETEFKPLKNFFINNSNIKDLENKFNVTFPASFISTIKKFNDSIPDKRVIYKIDSDKEISIIDRYISYNTEDKNNVLIKSFVSIKEGVIECIKLRDAIEEKYSTEQNLLSIENLCAI